MERKHSISQVNRAGDFIAGRNEIWRRYGDNVEEWERRIDAAFDIVTDWRSIHGVPLKTVSNMLARRAVKIDASAIVAQRLKRFPSIRVKLQNSPVNNLSTMQDIAGCRAVVGTVTDAYALKHLYESKSKRSTFSQELIERWSKDYIQSPKPDGYRSLHLVVKFRTNYKRISHCNGLRVEIQIRSKMQHAWAMAVETASAVTNQALKSGSGADEWKRFFLLVGALIAYNEGTQLVCNLDLESLRREASDLARSLKVITLLESMQHVLESFSGFGAGDLYLLELDSKAREIRYKGFTKSQFADAIEEYRRAERGKQKDTDVHIVLVSVGSLHQLKTAYPSFFLDSSGFIQVMREQIYGRV